jgi:hypothetical protein
MVRYLGIVCTKRGIMTLSKEEIEKFWNDQDKIWKILDPKENNTKEENDSIET